MRKKVKLFVDATTENVTRAGDFSPPKPKDVREAERGFDYRDRVKRKAVERVRKAESVGLEAGEG